VDPYLAIVSGTELRTTGVVVESTGFDGIVGMGTVRFGQAQFNDEILPFAFLDGLKVHQDFRGNGLGYQIANWRVRRAREEFGDQGVIATGMLYDNYASHAVATKWCREFAELALDIVVLPVQRQLPKSTADVIVRPIEPQEFEEFSAKQNAYHRNYNLFSPGNADSIDRALQVGVEGQKPYRYFAAVDKKGNLVAGAQTWARGMLKSDTINNPPTPLRILNNLLHLLPSDFTIRDINVSGLWYEPGQMSAAQYLWESIRWECREQGTTVTVGFDPRDAARKIPTLKPWHQPRPQITLAFHGPEPIDREKLFFAVGRV
jgi:hypothetical protein